MSKACGTAVDLYVNGELVGKGTLEFGVTVKDADGCDTHYGPPYLWTAPVPVVATFEFKPCYGNLWLKIAREDEFQLGLAELRNLINRFPPTDQPGEAGEANE